MLPSGVAFIAKLIPLTYFLNISGPIRISLEFAHPLIKGYGLSFLYIAVLFFLIETALFTRQENRDDSKAFRVAAYKFPEFP